MPSSSTAASTSSSSGILGTMIVIVLRAKNLPNRVKIGKQNPYTTLTYGIHKKRTEAVERGGQQPTWDAEFRFEIMKDSHEQFGSLSGARVNKFGGVTGGSEIENTTIDKKFTSTSSVVVGREDADRGKKLLKLACWADDPKDPKLVGEGVLELDETIKKGAFDDWVKLERKGRYAGEIYLELTWYPTDPPAQKAKRRPAVAPSTLTAGSAYGGPGARTDDLSDDEGGRGRRSRDDDRETGSAVSYATANSRLGDYPDPDMAPLSHTMSNLSLSQSRPPLPAPPTSTTPLPHRLSQSYSRPDLSASYSQPPPVSPAQNYQQSERRASYAYGSTPLPQQPLPPAHPVRYVTNGTGEFGGHFQQPHQPARPLPTIGHDATHHQVGPPIGQFEQLAHQHYEQQQQQHYHQAHYQSQQSELHPQDPNFHHTYTQPIPSPQTQPHPYHFEVHQHQLHAQLPPPPSMPQQSVYAHASAPPIASPSNALPVRPHSASSVYTQPVYDTTPQQSQHLYQQSLNQHQQIPSQPILHRPQQVGSPLPPIPPASRYSPAPPMAHARSSNDLQAYDTQSQHALYHNMANSNSAPHYQTSFTPWPQPPQPPQALDYSDQNHQPYNTSHIPPPPSVQQYSISQKSQPPQDQHQMYSYSQAPPQQQQLAEFTRQQHQQHAQEYSYANPASQNLPTRPLSMNGYNNYQQPQQQW